MNFTAEKIFVMLSPDCYTQLMKHSGIFINKLKEVLRLDDRNIFVAEVSKSEFEMSLIELERSKERPRDLIMRFYQIGELQSTDFRQEVRAKIALIERYT